MTKDDLIAAYGYWGEHPDYALKDWKYEVANGDTRAGYWEWVAGAIQAETDDGV